MKRFSLFSISRLLWGLVLVCLPVTSFRFMPFMGAGTYVRPLALYPLLLLFPVLLIRLKKGEISRPWPVSLTVLLAFILAAAAVTAYGAVHPPVELHDVGYFDRAIRAVITIVIGLLFFLAAIWMNQDDQDLRFSVRWLLAGLAAQLLWGAIQFIGLNTGNRKLLLQVQNLFSVRGLVKNKRISGFTYEPSWLAGQIAALYLPWLLAAILSGYRVLEGLFQSPGAKQTKFPLIQKFLPWLEPFLFLGACIGLLMTYSRSGILIAGFSGAVTLLICGRGALMALWRWIKAGFIKQQQANIGNFIKTAGVRFMLAFVLLAVIAGAGVFLADKGYIAAIFKADTSNMLSYAQNIYLGPRLAYASAALKGFEENPFTGVGLGASGFKIYQNMPDWILAGEPEIARQMSPAANMYPNPKNLYVRLLAETGLTGFILFLAFYMALFADSLSLHGLSRPKNGQSAGQIQVNSQAAWLAAAGIFTLSAVFLQGISQDSFAMPEMWINLGMLAGAASFFTKSGQIS